MLTKDDLFLLRQVAEILDREEGVNQRLFAPKHIYRSHVANADEALSMLVHHLEDHPELTIAFWNRELFRQLDEKELTTDIGRVNAYIEKMESGDYSLIMNNGNMNVDPLEFENYIDEDCIKEDIEELRKLGFKISITF